MIHVKVTNRADHDVFLILLKTTWFTSVEVDSRLCSMYFYNCWFLESVSEVDLKKMYFTSKFAAH